VSAVRLYRAVQRAGPTPARVRSAVNRWRLDERRQAQRGLDLVEASLCRALQSMGGTE
jgi:hypothetical protein